MCPCARAYLIFDPSASIHLLNGPTDPNLTVAATPLGRPATELPGDQLLFAYLPVRSIGLRFVVHADWELTSSRCGPDTLPSGIFSHLTPK